MDPTGKLCTPKWIGFSNDLADFKVSADILPEDYEDLKCMIEIALRTVYRQAQKNKKPEVPAPTRDAGGGA